MDAEKLAQLVGELDEDGMLAVLKDVMADGGSEAAEAMAACQKGMDIVGSRFETKEYFVSDLVFAGDLMTEAIGILRPALAAQSGTGLGKLLLCTVEGDLHDIGKNIVRAMLETAGFEVIDLGIDTPSHKVVDVAKQENIKIIGLSGVLTLALDSMARTIRDIKSAGLSAKVIIGGSPVTAEACKAVAADGWATNPQDGVKICREWAGV